MVYSRDKVEQIVIGTLLNEYGDDGFFEGSRVVLRKELFNERRNAFIFEVIVRMTNDGLKQTTPYDVFVYCNENGIRYGNMTNFCVYMCDVSVNYAFNGFKKYVKQLVDYYIREVKNGK